MRDTMYTNAALVQYHPSPTRMPAPRPPSRPPDSEPPTAVRLSLACSFICIALSIIGVPGQYDTNLFSAQQVIFALLLIAAWLTGLVGAVLGIVALVRSRGRHGVFALLFALAC